MSVDRFPNDVLEKIGWYVYRLIDPATGHTFYVGKGCDNRVFAHARGEVDENAVGSMPTKLEKIHQIKARGMAVKHVIHRHGLDEKTAYHVEAALIDVYKLAPEDWLSNLTNVQGGHQSYRFGPLTAEEIIGEYTLEEAVLCGKIIVINIPNTFSRKRKPTRNCILDAVRFMWKLNIERARRADIVLAHRNGIILGVFRPTKWLKATTMNFPEFRDIIERVNKARRKMKKGPLDRIGFQGELVTDEGVKARYLNKKLPRELRAAPRAPCRYVNV